jgi:Ca2+-binding EF-hand superfamily protein
VAKVVSTFRRGRTEDEKIEEISDRFASLSDDTTGTEMEGMMREVGKALDEDASEHMVEMFQDDMGERLE